MKFGQIIRAPREDDLLQGLGAEGTIRFAAINIRHSAPWNMAMPTRPSSTSLRKLPHSATCTP